MTTSSVQPVGRMHSLVAGACSGIVGGVVFGLWGAVAQTVLRPLLSAGGTGMLNRIAAIVGSDSPGVGFGIHLIISAVIGAIYGLILGRQSRTYSQGAFWGTWYGVCWLVLGNMTLLPLLAREGFQAVVASYAMFLSMSTLLALIGHLIYGIVTGLVYVWYMRRKVQQVPSASGTIS